MGKLKIYIGDVHIYDEHIENLKIQLKRTPFIFPTMTINKVIYNDDIDILINNIEQLNINNFELTNYNYHNSIKLILK